MDNVLQVFILILSNVIGTSASPNISTLWSYHDTEYYLVSHGSKISWDGAADFCRSNFNVGQLAILPSEPIIEGILSSLGEYLPDGERAWIGGRRDTSEHEQDFFWLNSTERIPIGERVFPPNKTNCIGMNKNVQSAGQSLQNNPCLGTGYGFLCSGLENEEGQCSTNFDRFTNIINIHSRNDTCFYELRNVNEINWYQSRNVCLKAGLDLATLGHGTFLNSLALNLSGNIWIGAIRHQWKWSFINGSLSPGITFSRWHILEWKSNFQKYGCLATTKMGWHALNCTHVTDHFICQTTTIIEGKTPGPVEPGTDGDDYTPTAFVEEMSTLSTSTNGDQTSSLVDEDSTEISPSTPPKDHMLYIIVGSLAGALLVLIIIVVVLVVCLRKQKAKKKKQRRINETSTDYETRDFSFLNIALGPRQLSTESDTATSAGSSNPTPVTPPIAQGQVNYGYAEPAEVIFNTKSSAGSSTANAYASTSINDVIQRERIENNNKQNARRRSRAGNALNGIKKRLSWMMKRGGDGRPSSGDGLPAPPRVNPSGPDVVADIGLNQRRYNDYELEEDDQTTHGMEPIHEAPPPVRQSTVYAEIQPRDSSADDDLEMFDNESYEPRRY